MTVSTAHDAGKHEFVIEIEQSVPPTPSEARKRLMHIPLAFGLVGPDGADIAHGEVEGATVENGVIHVKKRRHVVRFSAIKERPALSLNRGFSAPVTLSVEQRKEDQIFLARHDGDPFSRWQAYNTLLTEALIAAFRNELGGKRPEFPDNLIELAGVIAADEKLEHAFRALALALPGEADIAREIGKGIDPDTIFAAREAFAGEIARSNEAILRKLYASLEFQGRFRPDAASAGRRALRNTLLDYLAILPGGDDLASRHFADAANMTDRAAALTVLTHRHGDTKQAKDALAAFEERYRTDPLVMDKWLMIQATAPGAATLEKVRKLTQHPGFTMTNPNRVRALIGTFATANQTAFNRLDGEGYDFFARAVLEIERRNPQLAARLATALRSWRSLEPVRQGKAREALLLISGTENLSADLRDIVERTLA